MWRVDGGCREVGRVGRGSGKGEEGERGKGGGEGAAVGTQNKMQQPPGRSPAGLPRPFTPPPSKPSPRVQTCYCRSRTFHVFTHPLFVDFHSHYQSKSSASPSARFHKYLVNLLYPFGRLPMSLRAFPSCAAARAPLARFLPLPSTFPGRLARLHARLAA